MSKLHHATMHSTEFYKRDIIQNALKIIFHLSILHELIDDLHILFQEWYRDLTSNAKRFPLDDVDDESSSQF